MTDANEYGIVREGGNLVLNNNPPDVQTDYVTDNEDKMAAELMPDEGKPAAASGSGRVADSAPDPGGAFDSSPENASMGYRNPHNETSNTVAGINTPANSAGQASTDPIEDLVEQTIENLQRS